MVRSALPAALSGEGFRTEIGKLSIDPFKGLVAKNVEVKETRRTKNFARIERLVVSVNFADLLAGRVTIDQLQLDETDVSIPIGTRTRRPRLDVNGVSAELFIAGRSDADQFVRRTGAGSKSGA